MQFRNFHSHLKVIDSPRMAKLAVSVYLHMYIRVNIITLECYVVYENYVTCSGGRAECYASG